MSSSSSLKGDNKNSNSKTNNNNSTTSNNNYMLGTSDAASSYYFSTIPKTPAITSSIQKLKKKKQYVKSSKSKSKFSEKPTSNSASKTPFSKTTLPSSSSKHKFDDLNKENVQNANSKKAVVHNQPLSTLPSKNNKDSNNNENYDNDHHNEKPLPSTSSSSPTLISNGTKAKPDNNKTNKDQVVKEEEEHTKNSFAMFEQQLDDYMNDISFSSKSNSMSKSPMPLRKPNSSLSAGAFQSKSEETIDLDDILNASTNTDISIGSSATKTSEGKPKLHEFKVNKRRTSSSSSSSSNIEVEEETDVEEEDTLNKSVLSDTTELTASHYVFAAQAKQRFMMNELYELKKKMNLEKEKKDDKSGSGFSDEKDKSNCDDKNEAKDDHYLNDALNQINNAMENNEGVDLDLNDSANTNDDDYDRKRKVVDDDESLDHNGLDHNGKVDSVMKQDGIVIDNSDESKGTFINDDGMDEQTNEEMDVTTEVNMSDAKESTIDIISKKLELSTSSSSNNDNTQKDHITYEENEDERKCRGNEDTMNMLEDLIHDHEMESNSNEANSHDNTEGNIDTNKEAPVNISNLKQSLTGWNNGNNAASFNERISNSLTSPSIINLRQRALNARKLTSSLQKLKDRRESERKERRRRISTGGFMMEPYVKKSNDNSAKGKGNVRKSRYSLPVAPNHPMTLHNQHHQPSEQKENSVAISSLANKRNATNESTKNKIELVQNDGPIINETFDGGHEQLKDILGELVDNKDLDNDDCSEVSSIDRNFDLSKVVSSHTGTENNSRDCQHNVDENEPQIEIGEPSYGSPSKVVEDTTNQDIHATSIATSVNESVSISAVNTSITPSFGSAKSRRIYVSSPARHTRSSVKKRKSSISIIGSFDEMISTVAQGVESSATKRMNSNPTPEKMKSFSALDRRAIGMDSSSQDNKNEKDFISSPQKTSTLKYPLSSSKSVTSTCDDTKNVMNYLAVDVPQKENDDITAEVGILSTSVTSVSEHDKLDQIGNIDSVKKDSIMDQAVQDLGLESFPTTFDRSPILEGSIDLDVSPPKVDNLNVSLLQDKTSDVSVNVSGSSGQSGGSKRKISMLTNDQHYDHLCDSTRGQSLRSKGHDIDLDDQDEDSDIDVRNELDESNSCCGSDTADTMALHEIMADLLPKHHNGKSKRRRQSSIISLKSPALSDPTKDVEKTSNTDSDSAADTQDIKQLLSKLGSNDITNGGGSTNDLLATITEGGDGMDVQAKKLITEKAIVQQPKSILNSSRKERRIDTPKKSVEFRPPIAAEFNIGSPSMSITPMCAKKAKSLYKIPGRDDKSPSAESSPCCANNHLSYHPSKDQENEQLHRSSQDFESDEIDSENWNSSNQPSINESDTISLWDCSIQQMSGGQTATLERNLQGFLKEVNSSNVSFHNVNNGSDGGYHEGQQQLSESKTIDLETDLQDLLIQAKTNESKTLSDSENVVSVGKGNLSPDTNHETTTSNLSEISTTSTLQHLNTSIDSQTRGLEASMKGLLGNITYGKRDLENIYTNTDDAEVNTSCVHNAFSANDPSMSQTMTLETNMQGLLRTAASNKETFECPFYTMSTTTERSKDKMNDSDESFRNAVNKHSMVNEVDGGGKNKLESVKQLESSDLSSRNQTIDLEMNMENMLRNAGSLKSKSPQLEAPSFHGDVSMSLENKTTELDSNLKCLLNNIKEQNHMSMESSKTNIEYLQSSTPSKTVDLETNIQDLFAKSPIKKSTGTILEDGLSSTSLSIQKNSIASSEIAFMPCNGEEESCEDFHEKHENDEPTFARSASVNNHGGLSMNDASISQTVALETDIQNLLHNISPHIKGSESPLANQNLTPHSVSSHTHSNGNFSSSKSLKYSISEDISTLGSDLHGLVNSIDTRCTNLLRTSDEGDMNSCTESHSQNNDCRVSLVPQQNISVLDDDCISPLKVCDNQQVEKGAFDMKWEELYVHPTQCILNEVDEKYDSDFLPELVKVALSQSNYDNLRQKVNKFLTNVCEKMERDAAQDNEDVEAMFAEFCDSYIDEMLLMQKILRGHINEPLRAELKNLLLTSSKLLNGTTTLDFNDWEMQVALALISRIKSGDFEHDEERTEIQRRLSLAEDLHNSLKKMSKSAIKTARRKSLNERKMNTSSLELKIKELEERIAEVEVELDSRTIEQKEIVLTSNVLKKQSVCYGEVISNKTNASRSFDKFKSIEGIFSWNMKEINHSILNLEINESNIPGLVISVVVKDEMYLKSFSTEVSLTKNSTIVHSYRGSLSSDLSENVFNFIENMVTKKCSELDKSAKTSTAEIFHNINQIEWYIGRLYLIGKEISALEKRYNGTFQYCEGKSSTFSLQLNIERKQGCAIVATFEICEAYPFMIPIVELHSDEKCIDIKALERHLMKSSKPGFGYISRTCNLLFHSVV